MPPSGSQSLLRQVRVQTTRDRVSVLMVAVSIPSSSGPRSNARLAGGCSGRTGLNPFFVRSAFKRKSKSKLRAVIARSQSLLRQVRVQTQILSALSGVAAVSIPSSSGPRSNWKSPSTWTGMPSLNPFFVRSAFKPSRTCDSCSRFSSQSLLRQVRVQTVDPRISSRNGSLNPFFVRSAFKRGRPRNADARAASQSLLRQVRVQTSDSSTVSSSIPVSIPSSSGPRSNSPTEAYGLAAKVVSIPSSSGPRSNEML